MVFNLTNNAYSPEVRQFITEAWAKGNSATIIAKALKAKFGLTTSRSAICGLAHRMELPARSNTSRQARAPSKPKPPKPLLKPIQADSQEPIPVGPADDWPPQGFCQWPMGTVSAFPMCGGPNVDGRPYCQFHCAKAYAPSQAQKARGHFRADRLR